MDETQWPKHTTCISEAEKYEKSVWKGDKVKGKGKQKNQQNSAQKATTAAPGSAPAVEETSLASTSQLSAAEKPAEAKPETNGNDNGEASFTTVESKKTKKDKKRKRDTEVPAATSSEAPAKDPETTNGQTEQSDEKMDATMTDMSRSNGGEGEEKKKKKQKKNKKSKDGTASTAETTEASAPISAPAANGGDAKASLQSALSQALENAGEGGVSLKDILAKAGASTEELLGQLKVEKGKKGKYVLSL